MHKSNVLQWWRRAVEQRCKVCWKGDLKIFRSTSSHYRERQYFPGKSLKTFKLGDVGDCVLIGVQSVVRHYSYF